MNSVLSCVDLADVARSDLLYAATLPGKLQTADAIHLLTTNRLQADLLVAYEAELLPANALAYFQPNGHRM